MDGGTKAQPVLKPANASFIDAMFRWKRVFKMSLEDFNHDYPVFADAFQKRVYGLNSLREGVH